MPFEQAGVGRIDEELRTSTPWTFFTIFVGGSVALGSVIFGWIPITYGLGLRDALTSMVAGTVVGLVVVLPLIVLGSRTGTNNSTASGAHFGVHGRLVGSVIGLAIMVTSTAIVVWTGGGATVGVAHRLFDTPTSDPALAVAYAGIALTAVLVAVYGFHLLVHTTTVLLVAGGLLVVLMPVAFAGDIDLGYEGGNYLLGSFAKTWLLSAITVGVGGVLLVSTIVGDWTRYISPVRHPASKLLPVAALAVLVSYIVPPAIGTLVATAFADPYTTSAATRTGTSPSAEAVTCASARPSPGWSCRSSSSGPPAGCPASSGTRIAPSAAGCGSRTPSTRPTLASELLVSAPLAAGPVRSPGACARRAGPSGGHHVRGCRPG